MSEMEKDRNTGGHGYYSQEGEISFDAREAFLRCFVIDYITQDVDSFLVVVVSYTRKCSPEFL